MARPLSQEIHLYRPKLSTYWWIRVSLPAGFVPPIGFPFRPGKTNQIRVSLKIYEWRIAHAVVRDLQRQLDDARLSAYGNAVCRVLTDPALHLTATAVQQKLKGA